MEWRVDFFIYRNQQKTPEMNVSDSVLIPHKNHEKIFKNKFEKYFSPKSSIFFEIFIFQEKSKISKNILDL